MTIDINDIPTEPTITILNPDGSELITTNNPTALQYIRLQIRRQNLEGYKILTASGTTIVIRPNGKLECWTDYIPGAVFDKLTYGLI